MDNQSLEELAKIDIDKMMEYLRAEENERGLLENILIPQATSFVINYINDENIKLSKHEIDVVKRAIIFTVSDWYLHRDGNNQEKANNNYTGLNAIFDSVRKPGLG